MASRTEILPTDYAFRGVPISAGTHIVELRYEPPSLKYGLWLTTISMAAWLLIGIWRGYRLLPYRITWRGESSLDPLIQPDVS